MIQPYGFTPTSCVMTEYRVTLAIGELANLMEYGLPRETAVASAARIADMIVELNEVNPSGADYQAKRLASLLKKEWST